VLRRKIWSVHVGRRDATERRVGVDADRVAAACRADATDASGCTAEDRWTWFDPVAAGAVANFAVVGVVAVAS
jgi:hypothetical protein